MYIHVYYGDEPDFSSQSPFFPALPSFENVTTRACSDTCKERERGGGYMHWYCKKSTVVHGQCCVYHEYTPAGH